MQSSGLGSEDMCKLMHLGWGGCLRVNAVRVRTYTLMQLEWIRARWCSRERLVEITMPFYF